MSNDWPDVPPPGTVPDADFDDQQEQEPSKFRSTLMRRSQLRNLPPIEPLIEGIMSRRSSAVLVGSTGAGKTFLALSMACSVGTGTRWLGRPVHRCPVLYCVGEGANGLDARIEAWEQTWGVKVTDDDVVFSIKPDSLMSRTLWLEMTAEAKDLGAGLVVLDTFSSLAPDADETKDAATVTNRMSSLAVAIDGTSLLVHHPGWGDSERTRGGYQLTANVDEVLLLRGNAQSDLIDLERQKVKEGRAGARLPLRRRPAYGSVVIEASTGAATTVVEINKAEQVARVVFGTQQFSGAALRDALMERLEITRSTAYERIKEMVESEAIVKVGGTNRTPVYEVAK